MERASPEEEAQAFSWEQLLLGSFEFGNRSLPSWSRRKPQKMPSQTRIIRTVYYGQYARSMELGIINLSTQYSPHFYRIRFFGSHTRRTPDTFSIDLLRGVSVGYKNGQRLGSSRDAK